MGWGGFSFKRAIGISKAKARISRATGIPLTKSGRDAKVGRAVRKMGCLAAPLLIGGRRNDAQDSGGDLGLGGVLIVVGFLAFVIYLGAYALRVPSATPYQVAAKNGIRAPRFAAPAPPAEVAAVKPPSPPPEAEAEATPAIPPPPPEQVAPLALEDAIQEFVDMKIIGRTTFRQDVARVRVTRHFITSDAEQQNFVLRAIWSYYYEGRPPKTKLFVMNDSTSKEIGVYNDADGYQPHAPAVASAREQAPNPVPSAPILWSSPNSVHVKGYYRKDGTYVRPHTRRR